jgi:tellurite resistance protein
MEHIEAEACLRILRTVATTDGQVDATEREALAVLGERGDLLPERDVDVDREARRLRSAEARRVTFEAAVALASIDGRVSPEEHRLLERLRQALDLSDSFDLAVAEGEWRERLRAHRQELAEADADFLHRIAAETRQAPLDRNLYVALVTDLRARKQSILREALPPVETT